MTTIDSLNRFLEIQIKEWCHTNKEPKPFKRGPVIAISRKPGCDGDLIARALAKELGLVVYDSIVVEAIARDAQVSEQVVATLEDHFRSDLDDWLDSLTLNTVLSNDLYLRCLRKILFTIATHGSAIIMGRGANFLLPADKRTLGLFLVAPLEMRLKNAMGSLDLSREMAQKHLAHMEREQRLWVNKFGCADLDDATNYHLVINTALVPPETIVQIVRKILGERQDHDDAKPKGTGQNASST